MKDPLDERSTSTLKPIPMKNTNRSVLVLIWSLNKIYLPLYRTFVYFFRQNACVRVWERTFFFPT